MTTTADDIAARVMALGPYPPAPKPPPPPQTLADAIDLLAYGDRGVVDRPDVIAFIGEQIDAMVAAEREACARAAEAASDAAPLGTRQSTTVRIVAAIRARGDR